MITHVTLVLIILMAGDIPDVQQRYPMETEDECWAAAKDWVAQPMPKLENAVGLGATCAFEMAGDNP